MREIQKVFLTYFKIIRQPLLPDDRPEISLYEPGDHILRIIVLPVRADIVILFKGQFILPIQQEGDTILLSLSPDRDKLMSPVSNEM